ncbi:exodeoxyribonuclease VII large subunit [Marinospirillum insulare]|uniref:Exodeoxyribonuclease 7 large subunit n=1 Tax=Marinospirillum insulare TaxID=217169 RepID=A0ABQ5ZZJ9_9GAMM|nr:exodeoxyribonuclease VII large subunit [Marinospirillum insulare]GLR64817.1 exodeoxyribonuclease 7 large subunit [Marinospirillum insulare]
MTTSHFQSAQQSLQASLTVSQLNRRAKQLLEKGLAQVWVEGEVSNFTASSAGHWYFILKDQQAQLPCVMFAGRNGLAARRPVNGDRLLLKGNLSLYEGRGQYQLLADALRFSGEGDLLARLEALKQKLAAEGLFAVERKRALPKMPLTLGVISSLQGAALQDVLQVLKRRWPLAKVLVYPAQVQGAEAPASLRRALALAQYHGQPEVLLLTRGGGSLEDLQAFNDETLARMVAASAMPIITGVGHETDFTLVDFVADQRAATPSVAAEAASPDVVSLLEQLAGLKQRLNLAVNSCLPRHQQRLDHLSLRAEAPLRSWQQKKQELQYLAGRLAAQHPQQRLQRTQKQLQQLTNRLTAARPTQRIKKTQQQLQQLSSSLHNSLANQQEVRYLKLKQMVARLHSLSPLNTLARGYALAETQKGQLISSANQVGRGEQITVWVAEGALECRIEKTDPAAIKN